MKSVLTSLALVTFAAVALSGIGSAAAGPDAPAAGRPCPGCPQPCVDNAAAPMPDMMKAHLGEMKGAVAALRESETKLSGIEDPKAFRAAVIEHLKKLDDLQASHLAHMESMMGRMHGGTAGMDPCDCRCGCGKPCGGHRKAPDAPPKPQNLRIQ